uniref:Uncharacterized protein n=1 Tax=Lepeophtheirus salmonis TaxID=72036 RepID=A0A0K2U809_LEPSM
MIQIYQYIKKLPLVKFKKGEDVKSLNIKTILLPCTKYGIVIFGKSSVGRKITYYVVCKQCQ